MAPGVRSLPLDLFRPTWAEVDLEAMARNFEAIRARVGALPILAVVKADAYGHGAIEVARALETSGAEWLGVALPEEGVELRRSGLRASILLLGGFAPAQADLVLDHDLTAAVYRPDQLAALGAAAGRRGVQARVHLKIDSGIGRLGVPAPEVPEFAALLKAAEPRIFMTGAFSHLAVADNPAESFTEVQIEAFRGAVDALRRKGLRPDLIHLANSAAIIDHPPAWLTLVRPGIILYGYPPSALLSPFPIHPVLSLKTRIIYIKTIAPGTSLGYGRTWTATRLTRVASLPIGYDDGLPRLLGNRGHVLVRGRRAPIVGRISMDLTTVDVTEIPGAGLDDEVIVLGEAGGERLGADQMAAWADTIPWEILCRLGARVPRVYLSRTGRKIVSRFETALASLPRGTVE